MRENIKHREDLVKAYQTIARIHEEENTELKDRVSFLEKKMNEKDQQVNNLINENKNLIARIDQRDEQINRLISGLENLERDNKKLGDRVVQLESKEYKTPKKNEVEAENEKLRIENNTLNKIADDLNGKLDKVKSVLGKHIGKRNASPNTSANAYTQFLEEISNTPTLNHLLKD